MDDNCTSCGICRNVCPVENITFKDSKPFWNNNCQHCLACMHYCPQQAIQYADKTQNRKRYHHPEIALNEMIIREIKSR